MAAKQRLMNNIKDKRDINKKIVSDEVMKSLTTLVLANADNVCEYDLLENNYVEGKQILTTHEDMSVVGQQIAVLLTGAISFIVAFQWNEFLKSLQGNTFKNNPFINFVFVIGITLLAALIIYYITLWVEKQH